MTTKTTRSAQTKKPHPSQKPVCKYKANPERGEVAAIIGDKHCLFVPSFQNIAAIEREIEGSILEAIQQMSSNNLIISKIVPILVNLNDGDPLDYDEAYRWLAGSIGNTERQIELVTICYAVLDPEGGRFKASKAADLGVDESPNE